MLRFDGTFYKGEWMDDEKNGKRMSQQIIIALGEGEEQDPSGNRYQGEFKNGSRHGK